VEGQIMRQRYSSTQIELGDTLSDFYEETLTEPLPKRWVELIHALNEREHRAGTEG
jgi:hypothetical protein